MSWSSVARTIRSFVRSIKSEPIKSNLFRLQTPSSTMKLYASCHGIPERCFHFNSYQMRVCARCLGCSIGHMTSICLFFLDRLPAWYISAFLLCVMFIDWSLQEFFTISSTNIRRLLTGAGGGVALGSFLWSGMHYLCQ